MVASARDAFRHVFESVLRRCMSEGLVGGEGFAIDNSGVANDCQFLSQTQAPAKGIPGGHREHQVINTADTARWSNGTST